MRRITVTLMVCALMLVGYTATASAHSKARCFKGCVRGDVRFVPDTPSPTGLWTDSFAVGRASCLGRIVMTSRHPTPASDQIAGGKMALVTADGDRIWIEYTGNAPYPVVGVPSTIVVDLDFTIVGGTGRYTHASGGGDMTAHVAFPGELNLGPWSADWTWHGSIASAHSKARCFKGCVRGDVRFVPDTPSPTGLWTDSFAVGRASCLGRIVMTSRHPTPASDQIAGGKMALVTADGDRIWIEYTGNAPYPVVGVPSTIVVDLDFTIVGGTGRYTHASGGGDMTAHVAFPGELNLGPWSADWTWHGSISY